MLSLLKKQNLWFPKLKFVEEVTFNFDDDRTKNYNIYKLDWSLSDKHKKESWEKWKEKHWADKDISYVEDLPEKWDKKIKDLLFAIDGGYMAEIKRNSLQGVLEWNLERPFDTAIREQCLITAKAHIETAFMLLSDSIYDKETNYFSRGVESRLIRSAMLYKFWAHQTGRGLIWKNAKIDDIKYCGLIPPIYDEFVNDMKLHEKKFEKYMTLYHDLPKDFKKDGKLTIKCNG